MVASRENRSVVGSTKPRLVHAAYKTVLEFLGNGLNPRTQQTGSQLKGDMGADVAWYKRY
jgi:hypothetical protein